MRTSAKISLDDLAPTTINEIRQLDWTQLGRDVRFDYFTIKNVLARLTRLKDDPWEEFSELRQSVTAAMIKNLGYKS